MTTFEMAMVLYSKRPQTTICLPKWYYVITPNASDDRVSRLCVVNSLRLIQPRFLNSILGFHSNGISEDLERSQSCRSIDIMPRW